MAPTTSDLIFSEQANHNFSKTLGALKRHTLSIHNRLHSILLDSVFVVQVSETFCRPLVANERCGSWYVDPAAKTGSAYFKSTDGHTSVWKFNTRRMNLHLLGIIGKNDGCIIVDSTRRGKRMPDALSKTIPIWCCVLNRALFEDKRYHELYTPPQVVSPLEHSQIVARLDGFVQSFLELQSDLSALRRLISKPLRPLWVTQESELPEHFSGFDKYHSIICCTSSRRVVGGEVSEGGYIQGSGDDTENWAHGLTAPIFWENKRLLLDTPENEMPELIATLVDKAASLSTSSRSIYNLIPPTQTLCISPLTTSNATTPAEPTLYINLLPKVTPSTEWQKSSFLLDIGIGPHKIGSRNLRPALPVILQFTRQYLAQHANGPPKIVVSCSTGKDHSAGVALALLCLLYDDRGELLAEPAGRYIDKLFIRRRLAWISAAVTDANPSGATLQSVNGFLMERP